MLLKIVIIYNIGVNRIVYTMEELLCIIEKKE